MSLVHGKTEKFISVSQDSIVLFLAIFNHESISFEIRILIFLWKLILIQIISWSMMKLVFLIVVFLL